MLRLVKSMTGYGRGEGLGAGKKFTVEMKSVNHRFCEVVVRYPRGWAAIEDKVRSLVQSGVARGRIDVFINIEDTGEEAKGVKVDKGLALAYYNAMRELAGLLGQPLEFDWTQIARWPDVITLDQEEADLEQFWPYLAQAVNIALTNLVRMREQEGAKLVQDLEGKFSDCEHITNRIKERAHLVVEEYRQRLQQRVQQLLGEVPVDEARLAMEIALLAERAAIDEELVRLFSHYQEARLCLKAREPVGRKLDFLVQEMNREANTIGSKAGDLTISKLVVELKTEIEKIREQVQNLE
ncbi:YicC/YloC family endoribonuclease [Carboxydocella thermautotrophica]|uniref:YicC/YloC family endoribonuclease n=1 Tax=Carboxydocella thermautotrophica TaxID=178899 RepID=UPI0009CA85F7|nr:hypothetical protein ULO1_26880 [Carboxydocella sp. ULO1]